MFKVKGFLESKKDIFIFRKLITLFSPHITARLRFVLDFCFTQKGIDYQIVQSEEAWNNLDQRDLNYSDITLDSSLQIEPQGLLFESDIYNDKNLFFENGVLQLDGVNDPLSHIFYFLSRYEEYADLTLDKHGRRPASQNNLVKQRLNRQVVVDNYVKLIWEKLNLDYTQIQAGFKLIPSFDIDVAWAYKNRKFIRSLGSFVKGKRPIERIQVLAGLKKDPYDTYSEMQKITNQTEDSLSFILLGDWDTYDKNIHWQNLSYGSLIRGLNLEGEVGIHPSYASHLKPDQIKTEIERLETITGHEIKLSRQHFLRFQVPATYDLLLNCGIEDEYSMGFADDIGFRAGTSFPYYYFDLKENTQTKLKIHPFAYMDSALKDYLKLSPEKAKEAVAELLNQVKNVGGEFIMIWHNSSIHDRDDWKGWKAVLDFTMEEGLKSNKS